MTTFMDGLGYLLISGLIFLPVLFLLVYGFYEALGWRQILKDWTYEETPNASESEPHAVKKAA